MEQPSLFLSFTTWKQRLVFWLGAIIVGLVIMMMTRLRQWAAHTFIHNSVIPAGIAGI